MLDCAKALRNGGVELNAAPRGFGHAQGRQDSAALGVCVCVYGSVCEWEMEEEFL